MPQHLKLLNIQQTQQHPFRIAYCSELLMPVAYRRGNYTRSVSSLVLFLPGRLDLEAYFSAIEKLTSGYTWIATIEDWLCDYAELIFLCILMSVVIPFTYQYAQFRAAKKILGASAPCEVSLEIKSRNAAALKQFFISMLISNTAFGIVFWHYAELAAEGHIYSPVLMPLAMLPIIIVLTIVIYIISRLYCYIRSLVNS